MTARPQAELDAIATVVSTLRTATPAVRRRLCRVVELVCASQDGRFLESIDVRLGELERDLQKVQDLRRVDVNPGGEEPL